MCNVFEYYKGACVKVSDSMTRSLAVVSVSSIIVDEHIDSIVRLTGHMGPSPRVSSRVGFAVTRCPESSFLPSGLIVSAGNKP